MRLFHLIFSSYEERALATGLVNEEQAQLFQNYYQINALETCKFTVEAALNVKSLYPLLYVGSPSLFKSQSCLSEVNLLDFAVSIVIGNYVDINKLKDIEKIETFIQYLAYSSNNMNIKDALKFTTLPQVIVFDNYEFGVEKSLQINTWSKYSVLYHTDNFEEAISVEEEYDWPEYLIKVPYLLGSSIIIDIKKSVDEWFNDELEQQTTGDNDHLYL